MTTTIHPDNVTATHLTEKAKLKFNNMTQLNSWKKTEEPSAKVIYALAAQVMNLEKRLEEQSSSSTSLATNVNNNGTLRIPFWRTKKGANEVNRDGKI